MDDRVILVNENNKEIGFLEKLEAHRKGVLHRAFSIFVFNSKGQLLIHKRATNKYHSGGLWTNTCCSHPREGEAIEVSVHRRLMEEMGFDCRLFEIFSFIYKAELDENMTEHELDQVFIGKFDGVPVPNPEEVSDWRWVDMDELHRDLEVNGRKYTYWFKELFSGIEEYTTSL